MSLVTPTTKDISDNIIAQLEVTLSQSIPLLPKSFMRVLSKALAAVVIILYKYLGFISLQMFVKTASAVPTEINGVVITPLIAWGELIGLGAPVPATAELTIDITVENQVGTLPSGTQLLNASTGVTYITIGPVALNAPVVPATIVAAADQAGGGGAGLIGNLDNGSEVTFANPLANVARVAVVTGTVLAGADAESTEVYRQRVILRFQQVPQGGAYADYRLWATEPVSVINAYPYTSDCPGQVDVYIEVVATVGNPDGIPSAAQLQEALDSIIFDDNGLASRRPANALANTLAITRKGFDVEVTGLVVDDTPSVEAQITQAVEDYMFDREPFITGLSVPPRRDRITRSAISGIVDDIVSAANGIFTTVILKDTAVPIELYTLGTGEKAKADSVTFL